MNLLFVTKLDRFVRSSYTISKYIQFGNRLGHKVAIYGNAIDGFPPEFFTKDLNRYDFVIFVVHFPFDFPDLPDLGFILDRVNRDRRVIIDCWGRYNKTIRIQHDFNHLEKLDCHQGWEWIEAFQAISDKILQPTIQPLRDDVYPFLFHGFDPGEISKNYISSSIAAKNWIKKKEEKNLYSFVYVGHNWQRYNQIKQVIKTFASFKNYLDRICIIGWDWDRQPEWASNLGLKGNQIDPSFFKKHKVDIRNAFPYNQFTYLLGMGLFSPIIQRPLFNKIGMVSNRIFQTFCPDVIPLIFIPEALSQHVYGPASKMLLINNNLKKKITDILRSPENYWQAVLDIRKHLKNNHTFKHRFKELLNILTI